MIENVVHIETDGGTQDEGDPSMEPDPPSVDGNHETTTIKYTTKRRFP